MGSNTALLKERERCAPHMDEMAAMLDLVLIERAMVEQGGFVEFAKLSWDHIQPGIPISWGWAHDAVAEFIQAFIDGEIKKGIINIPPRMAKSTIASVAAPVFSWIKYPGLRWLTASYRDTLSTRDSVRSRRLIATPWYQKRWGDKFAITSDQNQKTFYENNEGGYRISQSVKGGSTGEGGNRIMADDPHNVGRAESDIERMRVIDWWDEEMTSRLDDRRRDGRMVIMQRLHEKDLSGHCLSKGGYDHLLLPMRYEPKVSCVVPVINFEDPRTVEGELLEPVRFPEDVLVEYEDDLGAYAASGQLQQRPAPRKGSMFDTSKIEILETLPEVDMDIIRYWDKAGTDKRIAKGKGAHTAGVKLGRIKHGVYKGKYIVLHVERGQWAAPEREQTIKNKAITDGKKTHIWVEQEPGSGGKESAESTIKNLAGFIVDKENPTGDKTLRAEPIASQVKVGNLLILKAHWNDEFIGELNVFPVGAKKDQIDGLSGAFNKLVNMIPKRLVW